MAIATHAPFSFTDTTSAYLVRSMFAGSRGLMQSVQLFLIGFAICLVMQLVDGRLIHEVSVWSKPAKFFLSLAVQLATVAWALSLLDAAQRQKRSVRWSIVAMQAAAWGEMAYILFRAARGEASHFNTGTPFAAIMYSIMGVGAVTLTATAAIIGVVLWRNRDGQLWREAAGLGLVLGSVLGTISGGYLSSQTGHWIGGQQTDATGLAFFLWSTTGGDLRVAHFVGLHAMQIVPFAAMTGRRGIVYAVAVLVAVTTGAVFLQAVAGVPLLRG